MLQLVTTDTRLLRVNTASNYLNGQVGYASNRSRITGPKVGFDQLCRRPLERVSAGVSSCQHADFKTWAHAGVHEPDHGNGNFSPITKKDFVAGLHGELFRHAVAVECLSNGTPFRPKLLLTAD